MTSSLNFVYKNFSDFYKRFSEKIFSPSLIEQREFAFNLFRENLMIRHKNFANINDLESYIEDVVPSDVYHSCAYYENPMVEMDKKGWLGADLIFDIDADHIPTPCKKVHDAWVCSNCGFAGKGFMPKTCPLCSCQKFNVKTWLCEICLDSAKVEAITLLDMLLNDFGFSKRDVHVFFSGHRGYHVHVESKVVKALNAVARKEIVDYVSCLGFDAVFQGITRENWRKTHALSNASTNSIGWIERVAKGVHNFIVDAEKEDFASIGLKKNVVEIMMKNKKKILEILKDSGNLGAVRGIGFKTWRKIVEHSAKLESANIDTVVTTDIHRLIRLDGTLHGKTGFRKVEFPVSAIDDFDPFKSAVAFKTGAATVFVSDAPEFRIGDEMFGPYRKQSVELPTAAAMLLVCKGRAEVIE